MNRALDSALETSPAKMHEVVLASPPCHFPLSDPERVTPRRSEDLVLVEEDFVPRHVALAVVVLVLPLVLALVERR